MTYWTLLLLPIGAYMKFFFEWDFEKAWKSIDKAMVGHQGPMIASLCETVGGASTIRSFNKIDDFRQENSNIINVNAS